MGQSAELKIPRQKFETPLGWFYHNTKEQISKLVKEADCKLVAIVH